ncbi:glucuronate isomerase [uncultured Roseobacter sp.]|uniref:glucuronate isomerase n=1 Tax=uncultured Roseobacter sp. TaxID=114847 RepID=UPI0026342888|nr:glucuronate isomerase [uncultured Roseobacter sp.]
MRELTGTAGTLYDEIRGLPIVSPHGHCDPVWFAEDAAFPDPAQLLVVPDHYVFRMLHSQGVDLADLGVGAPGADTDPRAVFRLFARHWDMFLGTPTRFWISYVLRETLGIDTPVSEATADAVYDQIAARLAEPGFRPRALFDRFGIEVLATTDSALDNLSAHRAIADSGWPGRVIPTFRPDAVLDAAGAEFVTEVDRMGALTGEDVSRFDGYLAALRQRRAFFKSCEATATDHAIEVPQTVWLEDPAALYARVRAGAASAAEARAFHGHMLVEMAQMSVEDGLVMQLHAGSRRNTNAALLARFGRDVGADMPVATDWVRGLEPLLNRVGNAGAFRLILFTLDESTYGRELAPMAGHWPCLRIGPPWWFHDSAAGIARYFDRVVETAGYANLAGFNDDTRAFLSIPARHDMWRRGVAAHLATQVGASAFGLADARRLARRLAVDLARETYRLDS